MKLNKCSKLVCSLYDKNNYLVHIRIIKTSIKPQTNIKESS